MWRYVVASLMCLAAPVKADNLSDAVYLMQQCNEKTTACRIIVETNFKNIMESLRYNIKTEGDRERWAMFFSVGDFGCVESLTTDELIGAIQYMYRDLGSAKHGPANMLYNMIGVAAITKCRVEI